MNFDRPRFDQPKTKEIIKTPAEVANELRAKIVALNERLQKILGTKNGLESWCKKGGHDDACKEIPKVEQQISRINMEREATARQLEEVTREAR